jgi:hypothetical protein
VQTQEEAKMKSKHGANWLFIIPVGVMLMVLSSCNMPSLNLAEDLATPSSTSTATEEVARETVSPTTPPTETTEPTAASTEVIPQGPTMTPLAVPLARQGLPSEEGPWLLFTAGGELSQSANLFIVNADGSGRNPLAVGLFPSLQIEINPGGDRFAYVMPASKSPDQIPHLIIRRIPGGELETDIALISEDMWQILSEQETLRDQILTALNGVDAFEWSPHVGGHYLAFSAALDNPKLDLYRFDTWSNNIRPLTAGPNHRTQPFWSPDGEWILHLEVENFGDGEDWDVAAMSAVSFDGSDSRRLYDIGGNRQVLVRWMNDNTFLVSEISSSGPRDLLRAKLGGGVPSAMYQGPVVDPAKMSFDDLQTVVAFCLRDEGVAQGVYFFNIAEAVSDLVQPGLCRSVEWWQGKGVFIANGEEGTAFIRRTGEIVKEMDEVVDPVALSPDGQWMASYGESGATLYTHIGVLIREIVADPVGRVLWRPDSTGMFIEIYDRANPHNAHHLYSYDMEEWELRLVDLDVRGTYFWAILRNVE